MQRARNQRPWTPAFAGVTESISGRKKQLAQKEAKAEVTSVCIRSNQAGFTNRGRFLNFSSTLRPKRSKG